MDDNDLKVRALELAVEYFQGKTVTEDVFLKHLQATYNFLISGKV